MDATPEARVRRFHLTPDRCVIALPVVEGLLWLSERFGRWHKGYAVLTCVATVGAAVLLMLLWFGVAVAFRQRFQFSIGSLFVLTVAVAMPFSWLAVEMKAARKQREAVAAVRESGGDVCYDWEWEELEVDAGPQLALGRLFAAASSRTGRWRAASFPSLEPNYYEHGNERHDQSVGDVHGVRHAVRQEQDPCAFRHGIAHGAGIGQCRFRERGHDRQPASQPQAML